MKNLEIRRAAGGAGVKLWEIAKKLGMTDSCFSRLLREELSDAKKMEVLGIIETLTEGKK